MITGAAAGHRTGNSAAALSLAGILGVIVHEFVHDVAGLVIGGHTPRCTAAR